VRLLLDTHAWLWFVLGDSSLSKTARELIADAGNEKLLSPASYWETAIKISIGKYELARPYGEFLEHAVEDQGIRLLPVLPAHAVVVSSLPFHHRDPFDRLMVAQALVEGVAMVSDDAALDAYGIRRLW
jgi:PIN domain nuclease of toxin-antitoxin system